MRGYGHGFAEQESRGEMQGVECLDVALDGLSDRVSLAAEVKQSDAFEERCGIRGWSTISSQRTDEFSLQESGGYERRPGFLHPREQSSALRIIEDRAEGD